MDLELYFLSRSNTIGVFMGIIINLYIMLDSMMLLMIVILIHEHDHFFFARACVHFNMLHQSFATLYRRDYLLS